LEIDQIAYLIGDGTIERNAIEVQSDDFGVVGTADKTGPSILTGGRKLG
jgi:hypothetical protein